jgi:hypothetical protein
VDPGHIIVGPTEYISCKERELFQEEKWFEFGSFS